MPSKRLTTEPPLQLELTGAKDMGPCSCCGDMTRRVWGFVHRGEATQAAYFVQWTVGAVVRHGAHVDLIIGRWGDGTVASDRVAVSLAFRRVAGPEFMVIDAPGRPFTDSEVVGRALVRVEVLAGPIASQAFEIVDAIWLHDPRIAELTTDAA